MGTLRNFITPYTDELTTIANELIKVVENFTTTDYQLGAWVTELSLKFHGQSANALNTAFSDYDMVAVKYIKSMEDGITALHSCVMALQNQTDDTEAILFDDSRLVISQVMPYFTLNDVATGGGRPLADRAIDVAVALHKAYVQDTTANDSPGAGNSPSQGQPRITYWDFLANADNILLQWGDAVQRIITTFNSSLGIIRPPQNIPMPTDNPFQFIPGGTRITLDGVAEAQYTLLIDPNQQNLARLVFSHYTNHNGKLPFGITKVGKNTILVTIAGLEIGSGQANDVSGAVNTGLFEKYNSLYTQEINTAILDYLQLHKNELAPGTSVILAGHSLGGMAAQLVAQQSREHSYPFKVTNVITFGSPPMYNNKDKAYTGIDYQLYRDASDPVPNLSTYNLVVDPNMARSPSEKPSALSLGNPKDFEILVPDVGHVYVNNSLKKPLYEHDPVTGTEFSLSPADIYFGGHGITGAHGSYINSLWLGDQGLHFSIDYTNSTAAYAAAG